MDHINDLYQELIIDHGTNPRNFESLVNPTMQEEGFNPLCGDKVTVFLEMQNNLITKATFQGQGCAISTASASLMTDCLINKTKAQAAQLVIDFTEILTKPQLNSCSTEFPVKLLALISVKNYPSRVKCATLAWHALQAALTKNLDKN